MRAHKKQLIIATVLMIIVAGTTAVYPLMIDWSYKMFQARDPRILWLMPVVVLAVTAAKGASAYGQMVLVQSITWRVATDMQKAMFDALLRADLARIQKDRTGALAVRFTNDTNVIQLMLMRACNNLIRDVAMVAALVGTMVYLDWGLSLLAVSLYPVAAMPIIRIGQRVRRASRTVQKQVGGITSLLGESLDGARMVKSYGLEAYEAKRASVEFESRYATLVGMVKARARMEPIVELLSGATIAGVMSLIGWRILNGVDTMGAFSGFVTALVLVARPVRAIGTLNAALQEGFAAVQRVFELLDEPPSIAEKPDARPLTVSAGLVRLNSVSFSYGEGTAALADVDIEVAPNTTVALVGPSGAGKSTVFNLIPRLYDADTGSVTIDGTDVRDVTLASLRSAIAVVSQDVILFNDTVRANIAFGRLDATDDEIEAAAKAAAAHDFITGLPNGYETQVGDRGGRLSGGERQRISLARAILKDAPILLLDEATSALDSESERQVQAALETLKRGRTTLVIAHRLATVRDATRIYVLKAGRIVETGNHDDLFAQDGLYARLCRLQFQEQAVADGKDGELP
ncbi:Lipid A export permease/ATP-binding protein MsbA [hydrothermal vent metagenome]|uniref:Lipid A export permease/ATP-binding protein MsbA n=1 Tax=hydrothermal vent metagenome TaxID=652676 RepID=A0A3B0UGS5_9ZZZZ